MILIYLVALMLQILTLEGTISQLYVGGKQFRNEFQWMSGNTIGGKHDDDELSFKKFAPRKKYTLHQCMTVNKMGTISAVPCWFKLMSLCELCVVPKGIQYNS